jgi:predicted nucleic acid-binding protein
MKPMRIPKVYLETSVFNFFFADSDHDKRRDTRKLFEEIAQGKYDLYTSNYVIGELQKCSEPKQSMMLGIIEQYDITVIMADDEVRHLAEIYIDAEIIPDKYITDAVHIAATTVNDIDFIVSYNFRHIVKRKTVHMTEIINLREGYRRIGIFSPTEVIENE